ncbi:MAG: hypothetical protein U0169_04195 [Polyangiaceae bacterium]
MFRRMLAAMEGPKSGGRRPPGPPGPPGPPEPPDEETLGETTMVRAKRSMPPLMTSQRDAEASTADELDRMSTEAKQSIAEIALALRDEQVEARVVHYKADLATSPELDAITAEVVAEFQQLRIAARTVSDPPPAFDRAALESELVQSLTTTLERMFRPGRVTNVVERKLTEVSKRFARFFFESELAEKFRGTTSDPKAKTMRFAEQALYYALLRREADVRAELASMEFATPEVHERAKIQLANFVKERRDAFLERTTPELNALVKTLSEVLLDFFVEELPPQIPAMSAAVVRSAKLADGHARTTVKVSADLFAKFRHAFELQFLVRLVAFAEEETRRRLKAKEGRFRDETLHFMADPHIFSDICELFCDAIYDYLYSEGFLDLPTDWRRSVSRPG